MTVAVNVTDVPYSEGDGDDPTVVEVAATLLAKLAAMVWFAVTLVKVYEVTAPTEPPSTSTSATW